MYSSYVGENAVFENQYLTGELEVELTPQVCCVCVCCVNVRTCVCVCVHAYVCVGMHTCMRYNNTNS